MRAFSCECATHTHTHAESSTSIDWLKEGREGDREESYRRTHTRIHGERKRLSLSLSFPLYTTTTHRGTRGSSLCSCLEKKGGKRREGERRRERPGGEPGSIRRLCVYICECVYRVGTREESQAEGCAKADSSLPHRHDSSNFHPQSVSKWKTKSIIAPNVI